MWIPWELYISCDSRVPGESFKLSHGPRFSWEDHPTSKASSFCKTQPSNCGKVPLSLSSLSSLSSCFCFGVMSQEQKPGCVCFFGLLVKSSSLTFRTFFVTCDQFWPVFFSHFGEARALPGDAVRPAGNQAQNISPSQRILVWRYSRFPTLLPFRMQTMCHDLCLRMIRIVEGIKSSILERRRLVRDQQQSAALDTSPGVSHGWCPVLVVRMSAGKTLKQFNR